MHSHNVHYKAKPALWVKPLVSLAISSSPHSPSLSSPLCVLLSMCHWRLLRLNQTHKDAKEHLLFVCRYSRSEVSHLSFLLVFFECALACLIKLKRLGWHVAPCCTLHNSLLFLSLCPLYSWLPVCYLCVNCAWADWWATNPYSVEITAAL